MVYTWFPSRFTGEHPVCSRSTDSPVAGRRSKECGRVEGVRHGDVADVYVLK